MNVAFGKIAILAPLSAAILGAVAATGSGAIAAADPLPYGPNTCVDGFVWREASPYDEICVTPDTRSLTAQQNSLANQNREPGGGPYGKDTCKQGFVWRDAFVNDRVCVTPDIRSAANSDNAAAAFRLVVNQSHPAAASHPTSAIDPGAQAVPESEVDAWANRLRDLLDH